MTPRVAVEDGFTLIECLVAAIILAVGLLGTFAMLDGASGAQGASRTREGAHPYRGESCKIGHRANDPSVAAA